MPTQAQRGGEVVAPDHSPTWHWKDLYSPHRIRGMKTRRMKWAGHVARTGDLRGAYRILVGKPEGKIYLEDLDVDGGYF
jgi:hypothetical protein